MSVVWSVCHISIFQCQCHTYSPQDFSVGGKYSFEVTSMPNVCGTPDTPFEVKIVSSTAAAQQVREMIITGIRFGCRFLIIVTISF